MARRIVASLLEPKIERTVGFFSLQISKAFIVLNFLKGKTMVQCNMIL